MKVIVAFDSYYGNTRKVAEMITTEIILKGHQAELVNVRETSGMAIKGDMLFLGSPTRMARMTGKTKAFAKKLDAGEWNGKNAFAFDTILAPPEDAEKRKKALYWTVNGAAPRIAELLRARGLNVSESTLRVEVIGKKGPLASDAGNLVKGFISNIF